MIDDDRMKVLYGNALAGNTPSDLTADEQPVFDQLVTEITEMRDRGIAPDLPINDVFPGDGIIAVS